MLHLIYSVALLLLQLNLAFMYNIVSPDVALGLRFILCFISGDIIKDPLQL